MAFRQSYSKPMESASSKTFAGKYGLKKVASMDKIGNECFVIPLDMQNGYAVLPYHRVRKNGAEGFKGSMFASSILCKGIDPATGERVEGELPLCCKIAQLEKDREPDKERSQYRMTGFTAYKDIIPVMVLSSAAENGKKPSLRNVSLQGIDFSFLDLADSTYREELQNKVIKDMEKAGLIDDPKSMEPEEVLMEVQKYLQHSIIRVTLEKSDTPGIPYQKSFTIFPVNSPNIGKESGEGDTINHLCKLLAGEINPAKYDAFFAKFPVLKSINNQVTDYLTLFNSEVDSLVVTEWTDKELQEYYDKYIAKQKQIAHYKDVNSEAEEYEETDEDVSFNKNTKTTNSSDDDFGYDDEDHAPQRTPKKQLASVGASKATSTSANKFNTDDLEENSVLDEIEFDDEDFEADSDDFGYEV